LKERKLLNLLFSHESPLSDSIIENFTVFIAVALIFYPPVSKHLFLCPLFVKALLKKVSFSKRGFSSHSLCLLVEALGFLTAWPHV
jgi:hypothetical protein